MTSHMNKCPVISEMIKNQNFYIRSGVWSPYSSCLTYSLSDYTLVYTILLSKYHHIKLLLVFKLYLTYFFYDFNNQRTEIVDTLICKCVLKPKIIY